MLMLFMGEMLGGWDLRRSRPRLKIKQAGLIKYFRLLGQCPQVLFFAVDTFDGLLGLYDFALVSQVRHRPSN